MNSTLKPVISQASVPSGGQASPAKANVASVNHNVGHPQGTNSHHQNSMVGQNLTHHPPNSAQLPHAAPSMAPVSANMAQMAHNMSHHGNLSHITPNSAPPKEPVVVTPIKTVTTTTPLSLVADKPATSQPLALTRTPDKKEENGSQSNGTVESPKAAAKPVVVNKSPLPEPAKDKPEISKTPSTPKVAEKPSSTTNTPQKAEATSAVGQADVPAQAKVAVAEQEKLPAKPIEPKPVPTADVPPPQIESKPETANASQSQEKSAPPPKVTPETAKETPSPAPAAPAPIEKAPEEPKPEKSVEKKEEAKAQPDSTEPPKKTEPEKPVEKVEVKKDLPVAQKTPAKPEVKASKPNLKLATVTTPARKRRSSASRTETPASKKQVDDPATPDSRSKRNRTQVQPYQSPTPELAMATKLSASAGRATPVRQTDDRLIVFYKNEYLAVRNAEGGFYVCQAVQNVYRTTRKIKIRWLSVDRSDPAGEVYKPDFYDVTDMECVLTTLSLSKSGAGLSLRAAEAARARSILRRALDAERGAPLELTEEHPDGLDLSLYKDESQLDKKGKRGKQSPKRKAEPETAAPPPPSKKPRSPRAAPPAAPAATKTATAARAPRRAPPAPAAAAASPRATRRPQKEQKPSPAPTPSTSTGKTGRTPRKPPAKK